MICVLTGQIGVMKVKYGIQLTFLLDSLSVCNTTLASQIGAYSTIFDLAQSTAPYLTSRASFLEAANSHSYSPCWGYSYSVLDLVAPQDAISFFVPRSQWLGATEQLSHLVVADAPRWLSCSKNYIRSPRIIRFALILTLFDS